MIFVMITDGSSVRKPNRKRKPEFDPRIMVLQN
jgi:hypothetical protein